jgi:hypothetical protein
LSFIFLLYNSKNCWLVNLCFCGIFWFFLVSLCLVVYLVYSVLGGFVVFGLSAMRERARNVGILAIIEKRGCGCLFSFFVYGCCFVDASY